MVKHRGDLELVRRMLAGDGAALDVFADRYSRALYRFALARVEGDRELAREAVQSAMTKALSALHGYRGEASLLTWLCACCRNEILMVFRARRAAPVRVAIGGDGGEPLHHPALVDEPDQEAAMLREDDAHLVHLVLDLLPPRHVRALELKYVERLPVREIAARLGVSEKATESLLTRARSGFRSTHDRLERERRQTARGSR